MATYQEELAYNHLRTTRDCLSKALEWLDNMEKDKALLTLFHAREASKIYQDIKKLEIEMTLLVESVYKALDD